MTNLTGGDDAGMMGDGFIRYVHPDDRAMVTPATAKGRPAELVFRIANRFGEWRHLEAHVTDLRDDRQDPRGGAQRA